MFGDKPWKTGKQACLLFLDLFDRIYPSNSQDLLNRRDLLESFNPLSPLYILNRFNPLTCHEGQFMCAALIRCLYFLRIIEMNGTSADQAIIGATLSISLKVVHPRTLTQHIPDELCFLLFRRAVDSDMHVKKADDMHKLLTAEVEVLKYIDSNIFEMDASYYCQMVMLTSEWGSLLYYIIVDVVFLNLDVYHPLRG